MSKYRQKIVAIGGGKMQEMATLPIDAKIAELTGKKKPHALFIPTASSDSQEYWEGFHGVYGCKLGCTTDVLFLLDSPPSDIEAKIQAADLIYVGGGNTLKMMRRWRYLGVDRMLHAAWKQGTVMAGLSAGAICWFAFGHSDSKAYYHPGNWQYIRVRCLGLVDELVCPHYNSATEGIKREDDFHRMIYKFGGSGIGIDDQAALAILDGKYHILRAKEEAGVYRIQKRDGQIVKQVL